ncbi:hypothetical protein A2159_01780 [Candidatus Woesebacteria bacterium RBG_13_34_9]|uniref:Carrier domain-containing protein n=1 Tax=Candidatus Woesebacteria bacterium RBG_13_34_9 TaxID=1802477 RepID=A0A1F7X450_9BACT|nr:MAG: hypothetical protein A2159_01780 [Candidatus Woesebacteria bacterium RBG_13_34_9]
MPNVQENIIKVTLAQFLGIEPEDINDDDSFVDDLHMTASEISDYLLVLQEKGIDISKLDINSLETISELTENLNLDEF